MAPGSNPPGKFRPALALNAEPVRGLRVGAPGANSLLGPIGPITCAFGWRADARREFEVNLVVNPFGVMPCWRVVQGLLSALAISAIRKLAPTGQELKYAKGFLLYFGLVAVLAVTGVTTRSALASQPMGQTLLIEIPAQPANAALNQFVQVTGFQLLYSSNIVQGLSTVAVRGKFPLAWHLHSCWSA